MNSKIKRKSCNRNSSTTTTTTTKTQFGAILSEVGKIAFVGQRKNKKKIWEWYLAGAKETLTMLLCKQHIPVKDVLLLL